MLTISRKYKSRPAPAIAKTTRAVSPAADRDELAEAISWQADAISWQAVDQLAAANWFTGAVDKVVSSVAAAAAAATDATDAAPTDEMAAAPHAACHAAPCVAPHAGLCDGSCGGSC